MGPSDPPAGGRALEQGLIFVKNNKGEIWKMKKLTLRKPVTL